MTTADTPVQRSARRISPVLLVLAALGFLLPFVGVSCNTSAGGSALSSALGQLGSSVPGANNSAATACLRALDGKDLVTYSGANLLTGSSPSTLTSLPGCQSTTAGTSTTTDVAVGSQPLAIVAFILVIAGVLAALVRTAARPLFAGGSALLAAVLLVVENATVRSAILDRLTQGRGSSLAAVGISGSLDSFFDVHAAIGFWLVMLALLLAVGVNAVSLRLPWRLAVVPAVTSPPAEPPPPAPPPAG